MDGLCGLIGLLMTNLLWIIGNGFDLNLGLRTGYHSFLRNCYFMEGTPNTLRDELVNRTRAFDPQNATELWSDLERLLGEATAAYTEDEALFHETFEDVQSRMVKYVATEAARMPKELPEQDIDEFAVSLCQFDKQLAFVDQKEAAWWSQLTSDVQIDVINLNYTTVFDRFWEEASVGGRLMSTTIVGARKSYYCGDLLHLHGSVNSEGLGTDIVFGVSDESQIAAKEYAKQPGFQELWIKQQKNLSIYGNVKTAQLNNLILGADAICSFGCSLGKSDSYIWREIASSIVGTPTRFYLFDYELPDRGTASSWKYQKRRNELIAQFLEVSCTEEAEKEELAHQIVPVRSSRIFSFSELSKQIAMQ